MTLAYMQFSIVLDGACVKHMGRRPLSCFKKRTTFPILQSCVRVPDNKDCLKVLDKIRLDKCFAFFYRL